MRLLLPFRPALRARHVAEITPELLAARGLRALILDLDNTLVPWHGREVAPAVSGWIRRMQAAGIALCIVSNTHRPGRLKELAGLLGVAWVPSGGKPRRRGFYRAMAAMDVTAEETAVVGDQVMTDIWGGNRCGLLTILVDPLSPVEFIGTRVISRNVERLLLRALEKGGLESARLSPEWNADE
ncbi:MAG TPA: YqeG family HAD IIIA-type phosphatase [Armatimonadota bacterium]|nr:YqeG family HAD IIIA-type phosphatase [Armatimonadota bacterium]